MRQKGFAPIIILLVLVILGVVGYFAYSKGYININPSKSTPTVNPQLDLTSSPTPDPTANWKTYTDSDNIFSIKYPSDWYYFVSSSNESGRYVIFSSTLGNTSPQTRTLDEDARVYITYTPNTNSESVRNMLQGSALMKYEVKEISVSGKAALRISPPPQEDDTGLSTYIYTYLTTPKWEYSLMGAITNNTKYTSMSEIVFNMLGSIKINQ